MNNFMGFWCVRTPDSTRAWPRSAGAEWLASRPWPQVWSADVDEDWVLVATTVMRMEYDGMRMRMKMMVMMVMKAMLVMLLMLIADDGDVFDDGDWWWSWQWYLVLHSNHTRHCHQIGSGTKVGSWLHGECGPVQLCCRQGQHALYLPTVHWLGLKENLQETGWFSEPNINGSCSCSLKPIQRTVSCSD